MENDFKIPPISLRILQQNKVLKQLNRNPPTFLAFGMNATHL
ncbi:hypothetical protein HMPREF1415_01342 [Helicobacter pylori GAM254Ai]|nr:hypothetical protein HMPREF1415_01342 [Helicobacter pylori GAM254Ai]